MDQPTYQEEKKKRNKKVDLSPTVATRKKCLHRLRPDEYAERKGL